MMRRLLAVLALGCALASAAGAQQVAAPAAAVAPAAARPQAPPAVPQAAASAGSLLQTIAGLTAVLGMLALFAWGMKRYGPRQPAGAAGLRIVGALNLGGRERIIVVEVGEQWIVVGASPGRVNALATMPKQEGPATLAPDAAAAGNFADWLKQTMAKRNAH
jgi:flagellar protein FliO/FliZ